MPFRYGTSTFSVPTQPCWRMFCVCVCVSRACVNPSGNDSEMTGPVGIVQRCHFQVPVSTFLLSLSFCHTLLHTQTNTAVWQYSKIHRNPFWCLLLIHPPVSRRITANSHKPTTAIQNKCHPRPEAQEMNGSSLFCF